MRERLRAAIIGAGFIGTVHARAVLASGAELVGVSDVHAERAAGLQEQVGARRWTRSSAELIEAPDVEVVHVCTPNDTHFKFAERALRAGKHVICEKPLATGAENSLRLLELADASGLVAAVPFVYRYYPMVREARERVKRGDAGRLGTIHGFYLQDWLAEHDDHNWRVDPVRGGRSRAFADLGVHWVDLVEFVAGHRLTRVNAQLSILFPSRFGPDGPVHVSTEDVAVVSFETDGGAIGSVVISQVSPGRKNRFCFSLDGTKASLFFDHEQPEQLWVGGRSINQLLARSPENLAPASAKYVTLPAGHPQGFQDCFNAFVAECYAAINGSTPEGLPRFVDGLRAAQVTDAVLASATSRSWVEVPSEPVVLRDSPVNHGEVL